MLTKVFKSELFSCFPKNWSRDQDQVMQRAYSLLTVRATTRSGYMMTSPTFAKWRPRRETRGKVTSWLFAAPKTRLEVSFPHTTLRAVTLDNEKSGVWRKNAVRWKFVRSWEVKRPNTRVFQLKEMPDKEQNIEKKKVSVIFGPLEIFFLKST